MSKTYLVSILSQHLIPNYLLIKELEGRYDELIFITTETIIKNERHHYLEQALGLEKGTVRCITITEDNHVKNKTILADEGFNTNDTFLVNLTGGTKMMSLAVYDLFQNTLEQTIFYYLPVGKNIICKLNSEEIITIQHKLSIKSYFELYGITAQYSQPIAHDFETPNQLFHRFRKVKFNRNQLEDIKYAQQQDTPEMRSFYAGGWFEEYCFYLFKKRYNLNDEQIATSVNIFREGSESSDNEIDIVMILNNELYVFECKVGLYGYKEDSKDIIEKYLYKLAAISKDYGLQVKSYLLTLHYIFTNFKSFSEGTRENIRKRQQILGIKGIFDGDDFYRNKIEL